MDPRLRRKGKRAVKELIKRGTKAGLLRAGNGRIPGRLAIFRPPTLADYYLALTLPCESLVSLDCNENTKYAGLCVFVLGLTLPVARGQAAAELRDRQLDAKAGLLRRFAPAWHGRF